jgi:hypothetical protein
MANMWWEPVEFSPGSGRLALAIDTTVEPGDPDRARIGMAGRGVGDRRPSLDRRADQVAGGTVTPAARLGRGGHPAYGLGVEAETHPVEGAQPHVALARLVLTIE